MNQLMECVKSVLLKLNNNYIIDENTLKLADESHLIPFLALSLDNNTKDEIKNIINNKLNAYILYDSMLEEEYKKLTTLLNKNKIQYSILKGMHLKRYYPESYLRFMCDIDVLVNKEDFNKAGKLLLDMGYTKGEFSNHDQAYDKKPFTIELHYKLISQKEYGGAYFSNPFSLMEKKDNSYEYIFKRKEDEYLYYLFHLLKHYEEYGIGLRNFIDLYLFYKNNELDFTFIQSKYKETAFDNDCIYLEGFIKSLLDDKEEYKALLDAIINDKTYGSMHKMMEKELEKDSSFKWLLKKIFPNLKYMKNRYSVLRHKIGYLLLPFLYIHHWIYYGIIRIGYSLKKYKHAKEIKK